MSKSNITTNSKKIKGSVIQCCGSGSASKSTAGSGSESMSTAGFESESKSKFRSCGDSNGAKEGRGR